MNNGWTALLAAAYHGRADAALALIAAGANLKRTDAKGQSAFDIAETRVHTTVAEILRKAQVTASTTH